MRRYSEPVQVRRAEVLPSSASSAGVTTVVDPVPDPGVDPSVDPSVDPGADAPPDAFIWHGRLYVVREVLAHWRERRAWWREALDPVPGQPTGIDIASREHRVWRVEASPGRTAALGVFDLVHDEVPHPGESDWRLVRVAD